MIRNKHITQICLFVLAAAVLLTGLYIGAWFQAQSEVEPSAGVEMEYAETLFDTAYVHSIDIQVKEADWKNMLAQALDEQYVNCDVTIDGTRLNNVALRPKGMTSLTNVNSMGSDRYSLKIDFDRFSRGTDYMGLDVLCLNNLIQDNTCMKDYFSYRMMQEAGAETPLCSYAFVSVNGNAFGLYLAVEGVEDSFARRVYGEDYGKLYKPELMASNEPDGNKEVSLRYKGSSVSNYPAIFENAVFDVGQGDMERVVSALQKLNEGDDPAEAVDIEPTLRYFTAHNFVVNFDSYTGILMHNYYLHEKDEKLSMAAWDYNLAFGGNDMNISIGGTADAAKTVDQATSQINYPIDTPVSMTTMEDRPMLGKLLGNAEYRLRYHTLFGEFISGYFESGDFDREYERVFRLILPYVNQDPTKFCTTDQFMDSAAILKEFCDLRAQSVRGQLEGTIPATAEGQEADTSALIDASYLRVSDMGTMMDGGHGGMPIGEDGEEIDVGMVAAVFGLERQELEGKSQQEIVEMLIGVMINRGQMDMGGGMDNMEDTLKQLALYVGFSLVLLIAGLRCALRFRRRR